MVLPTTRTFDAGDRRSDAPIEDAHVLEENAGGLGILCRCGLGEGTGEEHGGAQSRCGMTTHRNTLSLSWLRRRF